MTTTRAAMTTASKAGHFPSTLTDADSARIEAAIRAARSPQTRRAYASQWAAWGAWCASRGACPLPAAPFELAAYLAERAQSASTATVRMAKAAVVFVHKAKGEPSPVTDDVIEVLRGLAASKATERGRGQAKAITRDDFAVILARAGEPRKLGRGMETALKLPPSVRRSTGPSLGYSSMPGCAGRKPPSCAGAMSSPPPRFQGRSPSACARRRRIAMARQPTCA